MATGSYRVWITRESCLLLAETEKPTRLTITNEGEGTIILRKGWKQRNIRPGSTYELRKGFDGATVYMRKARRVKELHTPDS